MGAAGQYTVLGFQHFAFRFNFALCITISSARCDRISMAPVYAVARAWAPQYNVTIKVMSQSRWRRSQDGVTTEVLSQSRWCHNQDGVTIKVLPQSRWRHSRGGGTVKVVSQSRWCHSQVFEFWGSRENPEWKHRFGRNPENYCIERTQHSESTVTPFGVSKHSVVVSETPYPGSQHLFGT